MDQTKAERRKSAFGRCQWPNGIESAGTTEFLKRRYRATQSRDHDERIVRMGISQSQVSVPIVQPDSSVVRIGARHSWMALDLRELWTYRELLYFFVWRDIKVRYK